MSAVKSNRAKVVLTSVLIACASAFAAQLLWLRQASQFSPSPGVLGLFVLAPFGATIAFLGLWYLALRRQRSSALATIWFWLISAFCFTFWLAFFSVFVIGPGSGIAA